MPIGPDGRCSVVTELFFVVFVGKERKGANVNLYVVPRTTFDACLFDERRVDSGMNVAQKVSLLLLLVISSESVSSMSPSRGYGERTGEREREKCKEEKKERGKEVER